MTEQMIADHDADHHRQHRRECEFIAHRQLKDDDDARYRRADDRRGDRRHAADGKCRPGPGDAQPGEDPASDGACRRTDEQGRRKHPAEQAEPDTQRRRQNFQAQQDCQKIQIKVTLKHGRQRAGAKTKNFRHEHTDDAGQDRRRHDKPGR